jgi:hypothetical protein
VQQILKEERARKHAAFRKFERVRSLTERLLIAHPDWPMPDLYQRAKNCVEYLNAAAEEEGLLKLKQ